MYGYGYGYIHYGFGTNFGRIDRRGNRPVLTQAPAVLRQGESLEFIFDLAGRSLSGWVCNISVKQYPSDIALIGPREIESTNGAYWRGELTSDETALLAPGKMYRLAGVLTNATTDEERQQVLRFSVTQSWAA